MTFPSKLGFGDYKRLEDVAKAGSDGFRCWYNAIDSLVCGGYVLRQLDDLGAWLTITDLGLEYLKKNRCPAFPALGHNKEERCPTCNRRMSTSA